MTRVIPAALAALALAGCAAAPEYPLVSPSAQVSEAPGSWSRWLEVTVDAAEGAGASVEVLAARVASPYFSRLEAIGVGDTLDAGESLTLRVPVGTAECPAGLGTSTVELSVLADGVEAVQSVALPDAPLASLHATQCEGRLVTDAASPSFGSVLASEGAAVRTSLILVRGAGSQEITVEGVTGSRSFGIEADADALPAVMSSAQTRIEIPVTITLEDCAALTPLDAAGVLAFGVEMRVGGGGTAHVSVTPQGSVRSELESALADCS